jgi:uncharacterized membrane protein
MATSIDIFHSFDISAPARLAYETFTGVDALPDHLHHVEGVRRRDGHEATWYVNIAGVRREFDTIVLDHADDRFLAWTTTRGPIQHGSITLQELDPHTTRLGFWMRYEPEGLLETLAKWFGLVERAVERDLHRVASMIEQAALVETTELPEPLAA